MNRTETQTPSRAYRPRFTKKNLKSFIEKYFTEKLAKCGLGRCDETPQQHAT